MNYLRPNGNFHFEEDLFGNDAQNEVMIQQKTLLMMKFFQTKPQNKLKK